MAIHKGSLLEATKPSLHCQRAYNVRLAIRLDISNRPMILSKIKWLASRFAFWSKTLLVSCKPPGYQRLFQESSWSIKLSTMVT